MSAVVGTGTVLAGIFLQLLSLATSPAGQQALLAFFSRHREDLEAVVASLKDPPDPKEK